MIPLEHLEQQAIDAAINGQWSQAIALNIKILNEKSNDLGAHMRLGFAYFQSNKLKLAKKEFLEVLSLQPKNNIAEEHIEKINILTSKKKKRNEHNTKYDPDIFIELPGKTRTVHLVNLGKKEDLAGISIGEKVFLKEKRRKLEVRTMHDEFIGNLPDDISKRLCYFINLDSTYVAHVKEVSLTDVVIFIREVTKGKKVRQYPSFPSNPHVMLSDIAQLDASGESDQGEDDDEEDEDEMDLTEDAWEKYEQEKDLSSIVQLEDEDEEEE